MTLFLLLVIQLVLFTQYSKSASRKGLQEGGAPVWSITPVLVFGSIVYRWFVHSVLSDQMTLLKSVVTMLSSTEACCLWRGADVTQTCCSPVARTIVFCAGTRTVMFRMEKWVHGTTLDIFWFKNKIVTFYVLFLWRGHFSRTKSVFLCVLQHCYSIFSWIECNKCCLPEGHN